jgi:hypothetical protein
MDTPERRVVGRVLGCAIDAVTEDDLDEVRDVFAATAPGESWADAVAEPGRYLDELAAARDAVRYRRSQPASRQRERAAARLARWQVAALQRSEADAQAAGQRAAVQAFRHDVLGDRLVRPAGVALWIVRRLPAVPAGPRVVLAYPADGHVARANVRGVTPLETLAGVSRALADRYGWQDAQATMFVLAGATPLVWPIAVTLRYVAEQRPVIVVTADLSVPATAVAAAVTRTHRRLSAPGGRRASRASERRVQLAPFVRDARAEGASWAAIRATWNAQYPRWAYADRRVLRRDFMRELAVQPNGATPQDRAVS